MICSCLTHTAEQRYKHIFFSYRLFRWM